MDELLLQSYTQKVNTLLAELFNDDNPDRIDVADKQFNVLLLTHVLSTVSPRIIFNTLTGMDVDHKTFNNIAGILCDNFKKLEKEVEDGA